MFIALSFCSEISEEGSEMEAENILEDVPQAIGVKSRTFFLSFG